MSKCIFGLGNPEQKYYATRHNAGFMAIDCIARHWDIKLDKRGYNAVYGIKVNKNIYLVKPLTYMNRSGECVAEFVRNGLTTHSNMLIIHDDMDIPLGVMRFKKKNGDGGHKGVRSVIEKIGTGTFSRLRLGIGKPSANVDPTDYVLSDFTEDELVIFSKVLSLIPEAVERWLDKGIEDAMNAYNDPKIYKEVKK